MEFNLEQTLVTPGHDSFREKSNVSERKFGIVVGGIFLAVALARQYLQKSWSDLSLVLAILGSTLLVLGVIFPKALRTPNQLWFLLGVSLHKITNPIILGLLYYGCITPIAVIMRALGKDVLSLKFDGKKPSYWIKKSSHGIPRDTFKQQF